MWLGDCDFFNIFYLYFLIILSFYDGISNTELFLFIFYLLFIIDISFDTYSLSGDTNTVLILFDLIDGII